MTILRIIEASIAGPTVLRVSFSDGTTKVVDTAPLLHGPMLEPLRDPEMFARVQLDSECGTVVWPNGADLAPEALHGLADRSSAAAS